MHRKGWFVPTHSSYFVFLQPEARQHLTANIAEIIVLGQVFGVHIHQGRGGHIGLWASEAETTLAVMLVDVREGGATARYGRHFFGIERFGNSQVFDGQHDDSPKGLVGLVGELSFGSQDILHRPCQLGPNTGKRLKEMKNMAFCNRKRLFIM
jgi:hypothetical protein